MLKKLNLLVLCFYFHVYFTRSLSPLLGLHPLDANYFDSSIIKCRDGSNSFSRDHVNDNFCDCLDGTDEPGTSACPRGKFYCRNVGSTPRFIFSSRVNDRICDCCDGSDEYDSGTNCPNTCVMGGNLEYKVRSHVFPNNSKDSENGVMLEELLQKTTGLKKLLILQAILLGCLVIYRITRRRAKSKRKHYHQRINL